MSRYVIEYKIRTLAENAVDAISGQPSFVAADIEFTQWDFSRHRDWSSDAWLATYEVEAADVHAALAEFEGRLVRVVPRVSFIGQAYIQYPRQPFLVTKEASDVGYFSYPHDVGSVGLMFQEDARKALDLLMADGSISEEFFLYWNDAVNTTGYSSKLLLMFAAIDALVKQPDGSRDTSLRARILGEDLKYKIYGKGKDTADALRNRLVHGEYFSPTDTEDYVDLVHKKVVHYFNDAILQEKLIDEEVVSPQRHFTDNIGILGRWIKRIDDQWPLTLKKVLEDCEGTGVDRFPKNYQWVDSNAIHADY